MVNGTKNTNVCLETRGQWNYFTVAKNHTKVQFTNTSHHTPTPIPQPSETATTAYRKCAFFVLKSTPSHPPPLTTNFTFFTSPCFCTLIFMLHTYRCLHVSVGVSSFDSYEIFFTYLFNGIYLFLKVHIIICMRKSA